MKNSHSNAEKSKKFTSKDSSTLYYEHLKSCCDEFQKSKPKRKYHLNPNSLNSQPDLRKGSIHNALYFLLAVLVIIAVAAALLLAFMLLSYIWKYNEVFFTILYGAVALIAMNIVAYFASFRWHMRKSWFFLASVLISIIAVSVVISVLFD